MNDRTTPPSYLEQPPVSYAGRTRFTQLEYEAVLANASIGIAFTRERKFFLCNPKFAEMFGWQPDELIGQPGEVVYASRESYEALGRIAVPVLSAGKQLDLDWEMRRKDGSTFLGRMIAKAISTSDPRQGTVWIVEDITDRKRADEEIRRLAAESKLILDNATSGILFARNRVIQRCNRRIEEMVGAAPGELDGQSSAELFADRKDWESAVRQAYEGTPAGQMHDAVWRFKRKDGSTFLCRTRGRRIGEGGEDQEWIWSYEDVTLEHAARESLERAVAERTAELKAANERLGAEIGDRREAEERAQHLADHDALTGLPNRRLLEDRLTQALALSQRNRKQTAVMFVDLDRFKAINDSLGHAVGDLVLKEVAQRLVKQLRIGDTICRIGGDEFVVVLPEAKRSTDAANVAAKIIETLSQPVRAADRELTVTPSIGIAVYPDDGRDAEALIRNADAAMYHAKESGRANYQFFTEQMNQVASRRLALENDLRRALHKGELLVHYQPIVELSSGTVVAHEALVRWQHPARGVVPPAEFMQLAEDTGLIVGIGEWVLREACRWATFIGAEHGVQVAVNLSSRQFNDPKLIELVRRVLADSGLPARLLMLEITETTAMHQTDVAASTLQKLKELGVSLAIDDFGTGYSSLASLRRYPVDQLKIDRSFVADLPAGENAKTLTGGIIGLAHALGLKVVAEGVETEAQREFLAALGCDFAQGYLTGKPVDADSAAADYL
jgi:diguanylate cyclase (GGDEF)-like protein/PAS domain S-box-containing protein